MKWESNLILIIVTDNDLAISLNGSKFFHFNCQSKEEAIATAEKIYKVFKD